jgi:hypothetical protein
MIPQNDTEREILSRLQKLEKIIFGGKTFEDNYGKNPKASESQSKEAEKPSQ